MKTGIYYFTGTGNSLAAAKSICTHLGDCELLSIASLTGTRGEITQKADRVGIVCPVEAIQYGRKTKKRGRYHHPALTIADMKAQRGD